MLDDFLEKGLATEVYITVVLENTGFKARGDLPAVPCSYISVDKALLGEVLHSTGYLGAHHSKTFLCFKNLDAV